MKVLVVGAGGREHALSWRISQSPIVKEVYVAPGNGGTELESLLTNIEIQADDIEGLASFALENEIDLTVVGPEDPLVNGITDRFNELSLKCFGPSKGAAQLEGSKEFMKDFLKRHNIPTAEYSTFDSTKKAIEYVEVKEVIMRGKPPYRRTTTMMPVYDVAQLEMLEEEDDKQRRGTRPPFKRN